MLKKAPIFSFYEFFAGAGMARAGLGSNWSCAFANEFDLKKSVIYKKNWAPNDALKVADVATLSSGDLPGIADLVWASFPCQDLSLAGAGAGLKGDRSGTFWPFWRLVEKLNAEGRGPKVITLENVCGTLTSHDGKDFGAICSALYKAGYFFGAIVADAAHFLPQSRPRLFIIAIREDIALSAASAASDAPSTVWHGKGLLKAFDRLPSKIKSKWLWWDLPVPRERKANLIDLLEDEPQGVAWNSPQEVAKLLSMMSEINIDKVKEARLLARKVVGTIYKRTRRNEFGQKVQRAEVRFDDIAGCLRTPGGGSSRQVIMTVEGNVVRSRLISPRETARLMGLPDTYELPATYNEAYHLTGDGVAVPVVRHLAKHIFEPVLSSVTHLSKAAA